MLSKIFQFNKKLNQYRYIIPNNGDIISHIKNTDYDEYKMLTPTEFEKYHGGVCWDYVAYQADYFNTHFPKVSYKVYFLCFVNDDDNPTHTFMVFKYNDKYYWFESSWKKEQGIKMYNSEQDALNDIKRRMIEFDGRQFKKSFCIDFNPLDSVLFGMSCDEYKNYMSNLHKRNLYESIMTRTFEDTDEILREINEFHIGNMIPQVGLSGSIIQKTEDDYKFNLDNIPESNILSDIMTEKSKIRKNDKGKVVPDKCPKCGSKIGVFLKGEPVYLCTNKKCNKYFGTLPCNINEASSDDTPLYFVSKVKFTSDKTLSPRIPQNFLVDNGYEDNKTRRVCFSTSIDGALMALSQNLKDSDLYVYSPVGVSSSDVYRPNIKQVPDAMLTDEVWLTRPVKLAYIGKIHVKNAKVKPYKYRYGNKMAELYKWNWSWTEK